jgi:hypothetical protein
MTDIQRPSEEELARESINALTRDIMRKRIANGLLAAVFFGLSAFALSRNLTMIAFCCAMIVIIGIARYVDATGHLKEVRRRSTKFLHAPLSVLQNDLSSHPSKPGVHS